MEKTQHPRRRHLTSDRKNPKTGEKGNKATETFLEKFLLGSYCPAEEKKPN